MSQSTTTPGNAERRLAATLLVINQLQPALTRNDRAKQNEVIERLIAMDAPMGEQWQALANIAMRNGELRLARQAIGLFAEAFEGIPATRYEEMALIERAGALREAYELMRTLPAEVPSPAIHAYVRGSQAVYLGEFGDARSQLELAVRLQPSLGSAWLALAMSADLAAEPELADRILAAEREASDAVPLQRAAYLYAKGKVHMERGEHRFAFDAVAGGANLMKSQIRYDRDADRKNAEDAVRGYSAEDIRTLVDKQTEPTSRTIFVTGLPRSGTTLVEQILTSHSAIGDGAEINLLPLLAMEIGEQSFPALSHYDQTRSVADAARLWSHLLEERFGSSGRVIDKTQTTTRFIGLAAALLPEAPLIWLTRDPLDCAWSCFHNLLSASVPWSFDLGDIAFFFKLEDRLLQQWQHILSDRLLVVPFEALVTEPEKWIRQILSHCGLAEEAGVFAPHENQRAVTTTSVMQVRQPINRKGIGTAEPYRPFLQPFVDAYYG